MATTYTVEPIGAAELDRIASNLIEAGGEVDRINMATSLLLDNYQDAQEASVSAQIRGESVDMPALLGSFDAADAWHLHLFAMDVKQAAKGIEEWAEMIDAAATSLYLHFNDGQSGQLDGGESPV